MDKIRTPGRYDYSVESHHIDFTGQTTYVALTDFMLRAAGDDADRNGFGVTDLNCDNCSWVLSRMAVEFDRRLSQYDTLRVTTWVSEISRMTTIRNMIVTDADGRQVAVGMTQWAVIDLERRTAVDIRGNFDYEAAIIDLREPADRPRRIARVNPAETMEHRVVYSDLDFNNHVTSMKYLQWMFDMLPLRWMTDRRLGRMDVNFLHEARYGQLLTVGFEDGERSLFEITNQDGLPVCKVALEWLDER